MKYETVTRSHLRALIWWASWGISKAKGGSMIGTCRGAIRANLKKVFKREEDINSVLEDIGGKHARSRKILD